MIQVIISILKSIYDFFVGGIYYSDDVLDAMHTLPVSQKTTLGNYVMDKDNLPYLLSRAGTGSQTYANGRVAMTVAANQYAISETFHIHPYFAGKSQRIEITFDKYQGETNVEKWAGYYTATTVAPHDTGYDGFIFRVTDTNKYFGIANANTGSIQWIPQEDWNLDKLNGTGKSRKTLNPEKFTVMVIDFLYLGGTAVRFGFKIGRKFIWAHAQEHSNVNEGTFVRSPHQKVRYEIRSTGGTGSIGQICAAVHTQGTMDLVALPYSTPAYTTQVNANAAGTAYLLSALRLNSDPEALRTNLLNLGISAVSAANDDLVIQLRYNPSIAGSPTWAAVDANSNVEYAIPDIAGNPSTTVVTGGYVIWQAHISSVNRENPERILNLVKRLGYSVAGTKDVLALCVVPLSTGTNADVYGLFNFQEY